MRVLTFASPANEGLTEAVHVYIENLSTRNTSLLWFTESVFKRLKQSGNNINDSYSEFELDGHPANLIVYSDRFAFSIYLFFTILGDKAYLVDYMADPDGNYKFKEIAKEMVNSFKITDNAKQINQFPN